MEKREEILKLTVEDAVNDYETEHGIKISVALTKKCMAKINKRFCEEKYLML